MLSEPNKERGQNRGSCDLCDRMRQKLATARSGDRASRSSATRGRVLRQLIAAGRRDEGLSRRVTPAGLHRVFRGVYAVGHPG